MNREVTYFFDLQVYRVFLNLNFKGYAVIQWGKSKNTIKTKNKIAFIQNQKYFNVQQKLRSRGVCHIRDGIFKPKQSTIQIWLYSSDNQRKQINGGNVKLDMTQILSSKQILKQASRNYEKKITNCPIQGGYIQFNISARLQNDNQISNTDVSFQGDYSKNLDMTFRHFQDRPIQRQRDRQNQRMNIIPQRQKIHSTIEPIRQKSKQRPLQFSFSPMNINERNRYNIDTNVAQQEVKNLMHKIEQKDKDILYYQQQNQKLKNTIREIQNRQNKEHKNSSERMLQLMNKYNEAVIQLDSYRKQKSQYQNKFEKLKEERNDALANFTKIKQDYQNERGEMSSRYEQRKKQMDQLTKKCELLRRENQDIKAEVFKKQSELINQQNKYETRIKDFENQRKQLQTKNERLSRQQSDRLMEFNGSIKDLKSNYDKLCIDREELQSEVTKYRSTVTKQQQTIQIIRKQNQSLQQQINQDRELSKKKYSILEQKFRQKQMVVFQIQEQFKNIHSQKSQMAKSKDQQLQLVREKFNSACKKIDQLTQKQESYENKISQLKVRIKNLENICSQHQKSLQEKETLITKAKNFINIKQQEVSSRQQFIEKAKIYMQSKQKELHEFRCKSQYFEAECERLNNIVSCKQFSNFTPIEQTNITNNRQLKIEELQNEIQQMARKLEYQQKAMEDLAAKNLQYEIELTVKNSQLQSVRSKVF